jgi:hypothetical protein
MLSAERQSGKSYSTRFEWSPKLKQAVQAQRYWHLRLKSFRKGTVSHSRLEHYRIEASIPLENDKSEQHIIDAIKLSSATLKESQRLHKSLRTRHLEALAEAIVLEKSNEAGSHLTEEQKMERSQAQVKKLLEREHNRQLYRKLGNLLHPRNTQGLGKVDVPDRAAVSSSTGDPDDPKTWAGPWISITSPTELATIVKD